ncbi:rapamycin-insensitive companion of mTOR [Trichonephila clavipes]|nr:rapamycin-insensitive companion of mTOR [Trichonephila clavipes]
MDKWKRVVWSDASQFLIHHIDDRVKISRELHPYTVSVLPSGRRIFQQDNILCHKAQIVFELLKELKDEFQFIFWSLNLPDLNSMEHIWAYVERQLRDRISPCRNISILWHCCLDIWYNLSPVIYQELLASMPRQVGAVMQAKEATPEIVQEILFNVVNQDVNISKKLGYLNGFVKLCVQKQKEFGISYKDIFCCLRIAFFHEACEVRAAGLRACRYVLKNLETVETFLQSKLQFLVSRSLDISLDNRIERVQALRLMRKVLDLNPSGFPSAFSKCLVAIANEGSQERDMIRPCLATLAQLAVLNPQACIEAKGVSALMKNIVEIPQVQASEAILGVIFFLINHPSTRDLMNNDFGLENLLAPFTDCHYRFPSTLDGCARY